MHGQVQKCPSAKRQAWVEVPHHTARGPPQRRWDDTAQLARSPGRHPRPASVSLSITRAVRKSALWQKWPGHNMAHDKEYGCGCESRRHNQSQLGFCTTTSMKSFSGAIIISCFFVRTRKKVRSF